MRFIAPIDTVIYGTTYHAGDEVDAVGWTRKQLLQFLGSGLICPLVTSDMGGDAYTHTQAVPAAVWDVYHAVPFTPSITVKDASGSIVYGSIEIVSDTHIRVSFSAPFSGSVYLS